ncbi:endonuclease/exonuclease/phosphatase family protein [Chryseobacterium wangxinyae]|uniref:endonuclease/exonuclease/phosphatase family protein n=1 Tax=Chryseobacterium sp. CY350 TaxID=2997336 RepID=UPI0022709BEB|nr:endonuclease/exonuclease/phosphatase family protein [Chryseobacterium sp. CY350]MCY0976175.1 endonuclease/exonuclease/phosphatase family protein [Chryseobacterium sp. CY350]WBZ94227.1 endonuclease/exonuclease/phosphatase family protein [Chryseobacterium sp. CY350]
MKRAYVFLSVHIFVILLLMCTFANAWIAPQYFSKLNLLSLGFPYLILLHLIFTIVWVLKKNRIAIVFALSTCMFYNPIRRWVNFTPQQTSQVNKNDIKVLTYNVKYGSSGWPTMRKYITDQNADIILVQEKDTARALRKDLVKYPLVILKTKHKILRQQDLFNDKSKGNSFYADININGKIVRVINVYLEPFRLNKNMLGMKDEENKRKEKNKIALLFSRLIPTFKTHEDQVKKIRRAVDRSPYPVILAGDFNSVPNSWEYYNLGKDLDDAFVEAGNGSSTSFHDYKFPLRIDYIFTSKSIKSLSYKVDYSVKLSDHYPVIAEFLLN